MPAHDTFRSYDRGLNAPAADAFSITSDDDNDLTIAARAIYVGGGGSLSVVTLAGNTAVFAGLGAGTILPVSVRRVRATNTSATGIVGLV